MKQDLSHLPEGKQQELKIITQIISAIAKPEMAILFGSYARGDWVEDKYDEEHYRYQSDFDILVLVETKREAVQTKLELDIEEKIETIADIKTPTSILVHDIDFVNKRLAKAQYFFSDIKKEGIILYNSEKFQLKEARELLSAERKKLAQEDFNYWFNLAKEFFDSFYFNFEKSRFPTAAFLLHQATERLYSGILLVFTRYKPNTHDLAILRKLSNSVDNRLNRILPLDTPENRQLFKLLRKAYVDARYKPSYVITHDELLQLSKQVEELRKIGELICHEKIESFDNRAC